MATATLVRKGASYVNGEYVMTISMYAGDTNASLFIKTPKGEYHGSFKNATEGYFYASRDVLVRVSLVNNTAVLTW